MTNFVNFFLEAINKTVLQISKNQKWEKYRQIYILNYKIFKMQTDEFAISRMSEWPTEQRNDMIEINQHLHVNSNTQSQQFKKLKHIPMSKLSFKYIFIKKENQKNFYQKELEPTLNTNKNPHNQFYQLKHNFQEDVYRFVKDYKFVDTFKADIQQFSAKTPGAPSSNRNISFEDPFQFLQNRKRTTDPVLSPAKSKSLRKINEGGYFLNNWRSFEPYYCTKAVQIISDKQNLITHLVYSILDMDYDISLKIIDKINQRNGQSYNFSKTTQSTKTEKVKQITVNVKKQRKNNTVLLSPKQKSTKYHGLHHELTSLRIILKGLRTLCQVIKITDIMNENSELSETFFNRQQFNLLEDHYLNDPKAKINLLNVNHLEELIAEDLIKQEHQNRNEEVQKKKKFGKKPSYNLNPDSPKSDTKKILKSTQNLINYKNPPKKTKSNDEWKKFIELPSKFQKICILNNLMFLINFTKKIKIQACRNDYCKLIFVFLKNGQDQLETIQMNLQSEYCHTQVEVRPVVQQNDQNYSNLTQSSNIIDKRGLDFKSQIDYEALLLQLKEIKIYDRLNFATRLLSKQKKCTFINRLQTRILKFPFLDNLLLFTKLYKQQLSKSLQELNSFHFIKEDRPRQQLPKKDRKNSSDGLLRAFSNQPQVNFRRINQREKTIIQKSLKKGLLNKDQIANKMKAICQNYIDEYGDLATIAYLSNQYQCLSKFSDFYRQSLLLSYEQEQVQKLDDLREKVSDPWTDKRLNLPKKRTPFLSQINFRQEKVNEDIHEQCSDMDLRKCEICNLKFSSNGRQCFIQCSKCKHGGHSDHILKWYLSYQNCPNINCACICN